MKNLKAFALGVIFATTFVKASAQNVDVPINEPDYNKPKIFSDLPVKMFLKISETERLFNAQANAAAGFQLSDEFYFKGLVISKGNNGNGKTVIVKLANHHNAFLSLSRIVSPDGSISYAGRIMSRDAGDGFEIKKEDNQYVLKKINFYDLISE